jgi:hypothetical protein
MDKKLYILSKILIDNGTKVNDVVFESYPYDVQFHMLPYLWRHFEYCGLYSNNEEELQNDLLSWVYKYENITVKF